MEGRDKQEDKSARIPTYLHTYKYKKLLVVGLKKVETVCVAMLHVYVDSEGQNLEQWEGP